MVNLRAGRKFNKQLIKGSLLANPGLFICAFRAPVIVFRFGDFSAVNDEASVLHAGHPLRSVHRLQKVICNEHERDVSAVASATVAAVACYFEVPLHVGVPLSFFYTYYNIYKGDCQVKYLL